jgi:hypothetical protein
MVVPMLEEHEWESIQELANPIEAIKKYRKKENASLVASKQAVEDIICKRYEEMTGFRETNFLAVMHHRLSDYGPICENCGKPFRTPRAKFCAACGWKPGEEKK